jgi:hypothetical protein
MKKYKVELTEEQRDYLKGKCSPEWFGGEPDETKEAIYDLLEAAEPTQEKVWLPFTTLKDGGTYQTRDGKEFTVEDRRLRVSYPFYITDNPLNLCWTAKGEYDLLTGEHPLT